jgi:ABC-type branched-subunit amino acid transport system substrate-binding protein
MPFVSRLDRAQEAIDVGVVLPLSGPNAQFGNNS